MLILNQISLDLGGRRVLRNITAKMAPGSTVAVVGRNGAGKTTLLRAVMGLVPLQGGTLVMDGMELNRQKPHTRALYGFGYAPEERVIFPTLSVEKNLRLPCEIQQLRTNLIDKRLEYVIEIVPQLRTLLTRSGAALSGGQAKIVALGRALMVGTKYVLLDEPFQGLSPLLAEQYGAALKALRKSQPQLCVIVTESNSALLHEVQTETLYLERGELGVTQLTQSSETPNPTNSGKIATEFGSAFV